MLNASVVGAGYCAPTLADAGMCDAGWQGSWDGPEAQSLERCVQRCLACARCSFVSYSRVNRDCSWHHACAVDSLNDHGVGGPTYTTVRVRDVSMALAPNARCPRAAGRPGNGRALLDGEEAERPTRRGRAETVHVVTFYSEGPPHDRGKPLSAHAGVLEAAFAPHVRSFRAYSAREVRTLRLRTGEAGADVLAESSHPAVKNPGLAALGHMAVKPFLLLHRLEAIAPEEWLIFLDVNVLQHALAGWSRSATECT